MRRFDGFLVAPGLLACAAAAVAQDCTDSVGRLASFVVGGERVTVVDEEYLSVVRGGRPVGVIMNGMPLCPQDVVTVEVGAAAILLLYDKPEDTNELTLIGQSIIEIDSARSVLARIGRLFAKLRGSFDVRLADGRTLGARGTQFAVDVGESTVAQLEGAVDLSGPGVSGSRRISPMQQLDFSAGLGEEPVVSPLPPDECAGIAVTNSQLVAAAQPPLPVENDLQTLSDAERAGAFAAARERYLCRRDPAALADLGQAYADWAQPYALQGLEERIPDELPPLEQALYAKSIADGYRLAGEAGIAIKWYERALEIEPRLAAGHNGMGDAYRDAGLAVFDERSADTVAAAARQFDRAEQAYVTAARELRAVADRSGSAAVMVNLGNLALLRAGLYPDAANEHIARAGRWFEQALSVAEQDAPFAEIGLARLDALRAALIPDIRIQGELSFGELLVVQLLVSKGVELQRKPHLEAARDRLRRLLERYPDFSAAALNLGHAYEKLGDRDEARDTFRDAIRFDPANTIAYSELAGTLSDKKARKLYESTYRKSVTPGRDAVLKNRLEIESAATLDEVVYDVKALTPSTTQLSFEQQDQAGQPVTFTNNGSRPATVERPGIKGASAFRVTTDGCTGQTLQPGAGCTLRVAFVASSGTHTGTLVVGSDAGPDTEVALQGTIPERLPVQ
jgi:tetratricopeptide (TPR) repeat protein